MNEVPARIRENAKELNMEFNQKKHLMPVAEGVDFLEPGPVRPTPER